MFRNQYWFVAAVIILIAAARDGIGAFLAFLILFALLSIWAPRRS